MPPPSRFLTADAVAEIEAGLRALAATGGSEQVHRLVVPSLPVSSVLTVGLGKPRPEWPADTIRRAAGVAARSLGGAEAAITTLTELPGESGDDVCSAAVEGLILGAYRFDAFRSGKTAPKDDGLRKITVLASSKDAKKQSAHGAAVATAVATARDLVNTPPSHLFPAEFAKRAKALGESAGLEVEVLDDKALKKDGYGGVIGVGQGSSRPPRLVRLIHRGSQLTKNPKRAKKVALVGQGHHLRHRRHLDQAGGVDALHDLGHGRGGRGHRHRGAGRAAGTADRRDRHRADGREHAVGHRASDPATC